MGDLKSLIEDGSLCEGADRADITSFYRPHPPVPTSSYNVGKEFPMSKLLI
jgi:hypothetical protein